MMKSSAKDMVGGSFHEAKGKVRQTVGTLSLVYSILGGTRFGAVEWREAGRR